MVKLEFAPDNIEGMKLKRGLRTINIISENLALSVVIDEIVFILTEV